VPCQRLTGAGGEAVGARFGIGLQQRISLRELPWVRRDPVDALLIGTDDVVDLVAIRARRIELAQLVDAFLQARQRDVAGEAAQLGVRRKPPFDQLVECGLDGRAAGLADRVAPAEELVLVAALVIGRATAREERGEQRRARRERRERAVTSWRRRPYRSRDA